MKKIVVCFFCMTIFLTPLLSAAAYVPFVTSGVVCITPISFLDENGTPVLQLETGKMITASCEVKKGTEALEEQDVTLICSFYSNNELVGMDSKTIRLTSQKTAWLDVTTEVPQKENLILKAYVWDNLNSLRPLTEKAIFGQDAVGVTNILINQEPLAGFQPETKSYIYDLPASYLTYPEITVETSNPAAKAEIIWNGTFPSESLSAEITVTSPKDSSEKYIITFRQDQPRVTEAKAVTKNGTINLTTTPNMSEPTFKVPPTTALGSTANTEYGLNNVSTYLKLYSDRDYYCIYLPREYEGATYLSTPLNYRNDLADKTAGEIVTFDINRSATIYAVVDNLTWPWIAQEGFKSAANDVRFINTKTFNYSLATADNSKLMGFSNVIAKRVELAPGESNKTISLGGIICAVVQFDDSDLIQNAKMQKSETQIMDITVLKKASEVKYKIPEGMSGFDKGNANVLSGMRLTSDRLDRYVRYLPQALLGADLLTFPVNIKTADNPYIVNPSKTDIITFDLTSSATVYFLAPHAFASLPWLAEAGFEQITDPAFKNIEYIWSGTGAAQKPAYAYKKDYHVRPGDTVTVNLGGFAAGGAPPEMIFVQKLAE